MKRTVDFGPPVVAPGVAPIDPRVEQYAKEAAARRQAANLPKYTTPVGGMPLPPIPALDGQHREGLTMADHAIAARMPTNQGIFQPPAASQGPALFPNDLLPSEAQQDPAFRPGAGSLLATNQPELALKYGVVRNNTRIPPQQLHPGARGGGGLRQETVEGLKAIEDFNRTRQHAESGGGRVEQEAAAGPAGAAARVANGFGGDVDVATPSGEEVKRRLEAMDDFDFNSFRQAMMKDMLNNEEQRRLVEARLTPLDLTDLVMRGYINQTVPIIPEKFEPEFQSMSTEDELALKRLVMEETKSLGAPAQYMLDKYSVMCAALGVYAINKRPLPGHRDKDGNFDDDAFRKKFNLFVKYPFHMVASLGIHYFWFDIRVRKLFEATNLKNG